MDSAATKAAVPEPEAPPAEETIRYWGKVIKQDCMTRDNDGPDLDKANYREVFEFQSEFNKAMSTRLSKYKESQQASQKLLQANQQMLQANQQFMQELLQVQKEILHNQRLLLQPTAVAAPVSLSPTAVAARVSLSPTAEASTKKRHPEEVVNGSDAKRPALDISQRVKHSRGINLAIGKSRETTVSQIIFDLYFPNGDATTETSRSNFHGAKDRLRTMCYPALKELDKLRHVMSLIELVTTNEQWERLCQKGLSKDDVRAIAAAIESKCMEEIFTLELNANMTKATDWKKCRATPKYIGLGSRIQKYLSKGRHLRHLQEQSTENF